MVQVLGWSAAALAGIMLVALLWQHFRSGAAPSRHGGSFLIALMVAVLVNVFPGLVGASDSVRVAGSIISIFLLGAAAALLVRRRTAP